MGTKMKGLLKGLRYISQIFDEEKQQDIQIGYPTDVKHVAHVGCDGPSVDSPNWMNKFKSPHESQSRPLSVDGESKETPEIKRSSQDSSQRSLVSQDSPTKELSELPKSSRRHSSAIGNPTSESPKQVSSTKARQSRKNSSDSSKSTQQPKDSNLRSDTLTPTLLDIPKKSTKKKSKESVNGRSTSKPSKSKPAPSSNAHTSPSSDPEMRVRSTPGSNNELTTKPIVKEGEKSCNEFS